MRTPSNDWREILDREIISRIGVRKYTRIDTRGELHKLATNWFNSWIYSP